MSAIPARARVPEEDTMKLGTSLRFLYPTGPHTYERFKEVLATLPPGGFIERPMGAFETDVQAAQGHCQVVGDDMVTRQQQALSGRDCHRPVL